MCPAAQPNPGPGSSFGLSCRDDRRCRHGAVAAQVETGEVTPGPGPARTEMTL